MQWYVCIVIVFLQKKRQGTLNFTCALFIFLDKMKSDWIILLSSLLTSSCHLLLTEPVFFLPNLYALLFLLKMLCDTWSLLFIYVYLMLKFHKNHYKLSILCLLLFSLLCFWFLDCSWECSLPVVYKWRSILCDTRKRSINWNKIIFIFL